MLLGEKEVDGGLIAEALVEDEVPRIVPVLVEPEDRHALLGEGLRDEILDERSPQLLLLARQRDGFGDDHDLILNRHCSLSSGEGTGSGESSPLSPGGPGARGIGPGPRPDACFQKVEYHIVLYVIQIRGYYPMKKPPKKKRPYVCRLEASLDLVNGKWKPLILRAIRKGSRRYSELRRAVVGVSDKMLIMHHTMYAFTA